MVKITGDRAHEARLTRSTSAAVSRRVTAALFAGGEILRDTARHKILAGSVSGKGHIPSLPGQPPNADTHTLDQGIEVEDAGDLKVIVAAAARSPDGYNYAQIELGNSKVEERPFLRPSVSEKRSKITSLVAGAATDILKGV